LVKAFEPIDGDEAVDRVEQRAQLGGQVEISLLVPGFRPNLEDDRDHFEHLLVERTAAFGRSSAAERTAVAPKSLGRRGGAACLISTEAAAQVTGRRKVRSSLKMKRCSCAKRKLAAPSRSALSRAR